MIAYTDDRLLALAKRIARRPGGIALLRSADCLGERMLAEDRHSMFYHAAKILDALCGHDEDSNVVEMPSRPERRRSETDAAVSEPGEVAMPTNVLHHRFATLLRAYPTDIDGAAALWQIAATLCESEDEVPDSVKRYLDTEPGEAVTFADICDTLMEKLEEAHPWIALHVPRTPW